MKSRIFKDEFVRCAEDGKSLRDRIYIDRLEVITMAETTETTATTETGAAGTEQAETGAAAQQQTQTEPEKKYTDADLEAHTQKQLEKAKKKWEKEAAKTAVSTATAQAGEQAAQAQQQAAADESSARADKATRRELRAAAKLTAVSLGIPASRADYAVRMADLSGVEIDDDDGPDGDAIKAAMEQVLKDIPELKPAAQAETAKPGLTVGANNSASAGRIPPKNTTAATQYKPWNKFRR
ncbi:MAG: hypothetical protein ABF449_02785 [Ethanoligenens sp.]